MRGNVGTELAFWAVVAIVAAGLGVLRAAAAGAAARRARRVERIVSPLGLSFTEVDTLALIDHRFDLFFRGERPRVRNVVSGTWRGVQIGQAELWFAGPPPQEDRRAFENVPSLLGFVGESALRFSFTVAPLPADVPHVAITHRSVPSSGTTVHLESEEFDRVWRVTCDDAPFAFRFVTPPMMEWLLDGAGLFEGSRRTARRCSPTPGDANRSRCRRWSPGRWTSCTGYPGRSPSTTRSRLLAERPLARR